MNLDLRVLAVIDTREKLIMQLLSPRVQRLAVSQKLEDIVKLPGIRSSISTERVNVPIMPDDVPLDLLKELNPTMEELMHLSVLEYLQILDSITRWMHGA
jgi:hypothetical protein